MLHEAVLKGEIH